MQIRCRCGANLEVPPNTRAMVCAACHATIAVPQPEGDVGTAETVPAFVQTVAPTPPRRTWPVVAGALAVVAGAGIAIAVYALRDDAAPPPVAVPDAGPTADAEATAPTAATSPEELVVLERAAIGRGDEAALATLLAADAFALGIDAGELAHTGADASAMIVNMLGKPPLQSTWSRIGRDRDVAWIVDELDAGRPRKLMTSQLAFRDGTAVPARWRVAAWHVAELVPNRLADRLARQGKLVPSPLPDRFDDDRQVHDAMRAAFASPEALAAATSDRTDAINLGSAHGERVLGGAAIKRWLLGRPHTFHLHDGVAAGRVGDRVGWGAANVDYTHRGSTQRYRVLAVLVRERAGWRVVLVQWSNAGPVPG